MEHLSGPVSRVSTGADNPDSASLCHQRVETDLLGSRPIPDAAYYGIHTLRALENFPISGVTVGAFPDLVWALASIKEAAALTNCELGLLDPERTSAIVEACNLLRDGHHQEQFVVDMIQGGAGTSTNMNANEVIANTGLELMGCKKGDYATLSPNEHVNLGQSTNDVYPTALKIAACLSTQRLLAAMETLQLEFIAKAETFSDVLKMGRTQLQDAVPMTLGQEFGAFAHMLVEDIERLREAEALLLEINLGGTAIGTGVNAHPEYAARISRHLSKIVGKPLTTAPNLVEATQDCGVFVQLSSVLKRCAIKLSKSCNDLRLLSSGPRAGLNEITLPPVQAGSSIMPGKVNPVIPEVVNQVAYEVIGNDVTISFAAESGQLQLNAFEPIIAFSLFKSIKHLTNAIEVLARRCVPGISANRDVMLERVHNSIGLITVLSPYLGYAEASNIARIALHENRRVTELVLERGLISSAQLNELMATATSLGNPDLLMTEPL